MKRKVTRQFRLFAVWMVLALWVTACAGKETAETTAAVVVTEAASTEAPATEPAVETTTAAQEPETTTQAQEESSSENASEAEEVSEEPKADRYEEMLDRSQDEGKLAIYAINLGKSGEAHGDSTLLIAPDGAVMLVDAGHTDMGDMVVQTLKDLGIEKIDCLVTSHPHVDHVGGVPAVAEAFPIDQAYNSFLEYSTSAGKKCTTALKNHNVPITCLKKGDTFNFGEQVTVEILGPEEEMQYPVGYPKGSTQFINNMSLVMKLTYGDSTVLFSGDLYTVQELQYVKEYDEGQLHVTLAKANHHGLSTSNSKKWIEAVSPEYIIGEGDTLGDMGVYNSYVKAGAEYHHTYADGMIKILMSEDGSVEITDQYDSKFN